MPASSYMTSRLFLHCALDNAVYYVLQDVPMTDRRRTKHQNVGDSPAGLDPNFPRTMVFRLTEDQWQYLRGLADRSPTGDLSSALRMVIDEDRDRTFARETKLKAQVKP